MSSTTFTHYWYVVKSQLQMHDLLVSHFYLSLHTLNLVFVVFPDLEFFEVADPVKDVLSAFFL